MAGYQKKLKKRITKIFKRREENNTRKSYPSCIYEYIEHFLLVFADLYLNNFISESPKIENPLIPEAEVFLRNY